MQKCTAANWLAGEVSDCKFQCCLAGRMRMRCGGVQPCRKSCSIGQQAPYRVPMIVSSVVMLSYGSEALMQRGHNVSRISMLSYRLLEDAVVVCSHAQGGAADQLAKGPHAVG